MKRVFIACAALASMMMACTSNTTSTAPAPEVATTPSVATTVVTTSDIVYVDLDLVLAQCDIYATEGLPLQKRTETAQTNWSQKEQQLQADAAALQDKYQRGLITTTNAQLEQEKLQQRALDFQNAAQADLQKLEEENVVFSNRTRDLIRRAVDEINTDKKYKFIINAASLIDADTTLNITPQVIQVVNKLYAEESKKK